MEMIQAYNADEEINMTDGESSKAELLQKEFIWRYYCSYYDQISPDFYNYTKRAFTG